MASRWTSSAGYTLTSDAAVAVAGENIDHYPSWGEPVAVAEKTARVRGAAVRHGRPSASVSGCIIVRETGSGLGPRPIA